ncbi:hypothetical protein [Alterisphingorhabdus coralli]|uniref:Uncharacterized protein n=1 Tax=Alterisphingorhabdus coralli TaxID=3071408 RepID=A0AA97F7L8_9SPHN|nr:hypothetical protein [Parasphingorhabdus sp. SCSIO 66989]WOE74005.1 hypothetical protein RB602_09025 [Parasphingorhabdus sp. SCSIO 66989]
MRLFLIGGAIALAAPAFAQSNDFSDQDAAEAESEPLLPAASSSQMIAVFRDLCFAPFPSREDFIRGMEDNVSGFRRDRTRRGPWRWDNGRFQLDYISDRMAPAGVPAPQCSVSATIAADPDHLSLARSLDSKLLIGKGKSSGRRGRNSTIWTLDSGEDSRFRIFLKSEPHGPERLKARMIIMKLPEYVIEGE